MFFKYSKKEKPSPLFGEQEALCTHNLLIPIRPLWRQTGWHVQQRKQECVSRRGTVISLHISCFPSAVISFSLFSPCCHACFYCLCSMTNAIELNSIYMYSLCCCHFSHHNLSVEAVLSTLQRTIFMVTTQRREDEI